MPVTVEQIPEVPVGNKGVLIRVRNEQGRNIGKLWVGQAHVRWAKGNLPEKNAKKLSVEDLPEPAALAEGTDPLPGGQPARANRPA